MSPQLPIREISVIAALSVLVAGIGFLLLREPPWESQASLAVVPDRANREDIASLLGSFDESGTIGTRVEVIASDDILAAAGSPPVDISVRAVPDTRVIEVVSTGDESAVRDGLSDVLSSVAAADTSLRDAWQLQLIEKPSVPARAGTPGGLVILATAMLAMLAGLATATGLRRLEDLSGPTVTGEDVPTLQPSTPPRATNGTATPDRTVARR